MSHHCAHVTFLVVKDDPTVINIMVEKWSPAISKMLTFWWTTVIRERLLTSGFHKDAESPDLRHRKSLDPSLLYQRWRRDVIKNGYGITMEMCVTKCSLKALIVIISHHQEVDSVTVSGPHQCLTTQNLTKGVSCNFGTSKNTIEKHLTTGW